MCTNDSNSGRGSKTSSPLCLPSNKRLRRDECALGIHQNTTGELITDLEEQFLCQRYGSPGGGVREPPANTQKDVRHIVDAVASGIACAHCLRRAAWLCIDAGAL